MDTKSVQPGCLVLGATGPIDTVDDIDPQMKDRYVTRLRLTC